jgi:hypothetical protein
MPKSNAQGSSRRWPGLVMLPAFALAVLSGCDSDDAVGVPSTAPVAGVQLATIPAGAPTLLVINPAVGPAPETRRLLAVPVDQNDMWVDAPVTWESSNPDIATVTVVPGKQNEAILTALGPGTVTITTTASGYSDTRTFTVREYPAVASVVIGGPAVPRGLPGQTVQLSVVECREIGGVAIPCGPIEWSTSAAGIATVDQSGLVTFQAGEGSADIRATDTVDGGSGVRAVFRFPQLMPGALTAVPEVATNDIFTYLLHVPEGTGAFTVTGTGGTGDADIYLIPPAGLHSAGTSGITHWSAEDGNEESVEVGSPSAGTWRLLVHAWEGPVTGFSVRYTIP